jgi:hypothetical protein
MSDGTIDLDPKKRQAERGQGKQLPSSMIAKEFGKVYVRDDGQERHVEFTIWIQQLSGAVAEGWRTGIALDASASMKDWYGRNLKLVREIPKEVISKYKKQKWILDRSDDGCRVQSFKKEAYEDAIHQGFLQFTDNIVEPLVRDFIAYLANELDSEGKTTVIYWACGDGSAYEVIGDFTAEQCKKLEIKGPKSVTFGTGTKLTPSLKYFADRFADIPRAMFVFVTDGKLDDLDSVKSYTKELAKAIEAGKRNTLKCILIGVGAKIDEKQMIELDDLSTGTDVDIWDHKIASEMRALNEIMVELVDEVLDITATIYDESNQAVAKFTDGLPANVTFSMPTTSNYFELEVNGRRIRQSVI